MLTDDWRAEVFLEWYEANRPDVVLTLPDVSAWMKAAGIRAPRDCGLALFRLDQTKSIAGVDHRFSDIGAATVELVVGELDANRYGIPKIRKSVSIECLWREGPTVVKKAPADDPRETARA